MWQVTVFVCIWGYLPLLITIREGWSGPRGSIIFKPNLRQALNTNTSDSSQGIFGGVSNVIKNLKEAKETSTLVKSSLRQTKKSGKAGAKSGKNKGKKPADGGSKAKGKKGSKKKACVKNTKAKGGSGNYKEKEDSS